MRDNIPMYRNVQPKQRLMLDGGVLPDALVYTPEIVDPGSNDKEFKNLKERRRRYEQKKLEEMVAGMEEYLAEFDSTH